MWCNEPCFPCLERSSVRLDKQKAREMTMYYHGHEDMYNVAFYCLVWIIIHALLQEYIWEVWWSTTTQYYCNLDNCSTQRTVKRLHLSKVKTSKYYDSGCLVVFYLVSVVWGLDIIFTSGYAVNPSLLWVDYPHTLMRSVCTLPQLFRVPIARLSVQSLPQVLHADSNGFLAALLP